MKKNTLLNIYKYIYINIIFTKIKYRINIYSMSYILVDQD